MKNPPSAPCPAQNRISVEANGRGAQEEERPLFPWIPRERPVSPTVPLECTVYGPAASPDGFQALAPEWNPLLARSRFDTVFLTHEWQTTWWRHLQDGELWILAFRSPEDGQLVGIAPLFRRYNPEGELAGQWSFHLVGCIEVSDYLDLLAARGWEAPVHRALLEWLTGPDAPYWDRVDLCNLPEVSLTYRLLPDLAREFGLRAAVFQEDVAPYVPLPLRYQDYLAHCVDKKQRHEIRRKQRRALREAEVVFRVVDRAADPDTIVREMETFIQLQRMSRPDKAEFMTPQMEAFFTGLAVRMAQAGWLCLAFLELNGVPAAAYFNFQYRRRVYVYNSGYNPQADVAYLSPGWVLLGYLIQYAIARGERIFDFLQGSEEYKYRFGCREARVMRAVVHRG